MLSRIKLSKYYIEFLFLTIVLVVSVESFHINTKIPEIRCVGRNLELNAKAKKKKQKSLIPSNKKPTGGFGGTEIQPCPCGSNGKIIPYKKCCGAIHTSLSEFINATPKQVVQARYSAYANKIIEFIILSTHPENACDYKNDIKEWKRILKEEGFDNFILTKCKILSETINDDNDVATVTFVASLIQRDTKERTSFKEKSTFERGDDGAWLYKSGLVERPQNENLSRDYNL